MTAIALYDLDPSGLSPEQRIDALVESERELARLASRQQRLLTAISEETFADQPVPGLDKQYFLEQLRATLGDSMDGVRSRVATATALVHRLPDTLTALEEGVITARQAWRLAEQTQPLGDAAAPQDADQLMMRTSSRRQQRRRSSKWRPDARTASQITVRTPSPSADLHPAHCDGADPSRSAPSHRPDAPSVPAGRQISTRSPSRGTTAVQPSSSCKCAASASDECCSP